MAEWQRIANTTIHQYIREQEENILRDRKFLAWLKSKGRITFGHSGDLMDWKIRYKRAPMRVFRESETLTFSRINRWKTAQLDWRGYAATDQITKLEKLKNKNTEAIVKVYSEMTENLMDDITEHFGDELYIDGNLAANAGRLHGLESFLGYSGTGSAYIATSNDTYAGLSTVLGTYGGSFSSTWPFGTGDPEYDFWTPLIVDYTDSSWTSATDTWANNCSESIRYAINGQMRNKSKKGMMNLILLERDLYRQFEEKLATSERLMVQRGDTKEGIYALGFRDVINFDGVDITSEYGVPQYTGYGLALMHCEVRSLQDRMFVAELPDFDIASYAERFSIDFFGNMRCNPRYFCKFINAT